MATKKPSPKKVKGKKPAARKSPGQIAARKSDRLFRVRWAELTGQPFSPKYRVPPALISSLSTLAVKTQLLTAKIPGVNPLPIEITTNVRAQQGQGCAQQAEIGAFYKGDITVVGVFGKAGVLAILNAAAAAECCGKAIKCPKECPCTYTPQAALAFYFLGAKSEIGALLQGNRVWNCECKFPPPPTTCPPPPPTRIVEE